MIIKFFIKYFLTYLMKKQGPYAVQSKEPASCFFFDSPAFAFEPGKRLKKQTRGQSPGLCSDKLFCFFHHALHRCSFFSMDKIIKKYAKDKDNSHDGVQAVITSERNQKPEQKRPDPDTGIKKNKES